MSEFDVTIEPPPAFDITLEPPPDLVLQLGAQQGHQGIPGPAGGQLNVDAGAALNGHRVVAFGGDGRLIHASADNLAHVFAIAGLIEQAAAEGDPLPVRTHGSIEFSGWAWAPGPVFLGLDGQPVQSLPPQALVSLPIGRGDGAHLFINLQPPVVL